MPKVSTFTVVPKLPPALEPLTALANNLWWCWDHEAIELFYRIDRKLWEKVAQNPIALLGEIPSAIKTPVVTPSTVVSKLIVLPVFDEYICQPTGAFNVVRFAVGAALTL